jgi:hypothetical protein
MIKRQLEDKIRKMARKMPIISITGPRQSGKTTLAKSCFPKHAYANLEDLELREMAENDPKKFLGRYKKGVILDEVQHTPKLFSYIQVFSDASGRTGEYVLTGSQNFSLMEKITQSLAGRVAIFHLLPFSCSELKKSRLLKKDFEACTVKGFYPRVYDKNISPMDFYSSYLTTYLERDIRQITSVQNLGDFQKLVKLCAGRTGQLLNYSSLAVEIGVNEKTVKQWLSILETSFIIFFLQPYHKNFSKRIVKTPKLYFVDTGLASYILGIKNEEQLFSHFALGALFENLVIADIMKNYLNKGERPQLYFWRDNTGNEVDCLIEDGPRLKHIEIKSAATIREEYFKGLKFLNKLSGASARNNFLVYGGADSHERSSGNVIGWSDTAAITGG